MYLPIYRKIWVTLDLWKIVFFTEKEVHNNIIDA